MGRMKYFWLLLGVLLFTVSAYDVSADVIPSENECRPYIEKAIHELKNTDTTATDDNKESTEDVTTSEQNVSIENARDSSNEQGADEVSSQEEESTIALHDQIPVDGKENSNEVPTTENNVQEGQIEVENESQEQLADENVDSQEVNIKYDQSIETPATEDEKKSQEETGELEHESKENLHESSQEVHNYDVQTEEQTSAQVDGASDQENASVETIEFSEEKSVETEDNDKSEESTDNTRSETEKGIEQGINENQTGEQTSSQIEDNSQQDYTSDEAEQTQNISVEDNTATEEVEENSLENKSDDDSEEETNTTEEIQVEEEETIRAKRSVKDKASTEEDYSTQNGNESEENASNELKQTQNESDLTEDENQSQIVTESENDETSEEAKNEPQSQETMPEEELTLEFEIPKNLRPREHISALLGLDAESSIKENALKRTGDVILKELKKIYDNAVKPLETMYKYRDLSNRHFGDPEIFSKPLILFMGPWSGGKSTILNYLTDNEYTSNSIRSGAEPSPAHFNILMHGNEPEVLDGTQLAADWTFSGLQKFGQGLMDRLRGQRLPNKLLERVNIVEIPGILEVRKQVSRYFPFNDACQWFIDRADIIFLVYDPSKLDVGPETEAILDQLKGREYQTRILLNKADQVKPEELLRVQSALIWNISPLMSSAQPPVMYTVSLWSHPFEVGAPVRLLQAQERAFLVDLREAIDKRIENKIASARRFAVRIRNHAKMVDCYLTTYYNQKGLFSNKKQIADKIIEHPQNYNIYEGLSTLTNISRYDLPDPEVYLDFFRLNPLYDFKKLSETCTYFKGCPINKLDIAIAYDLPELVGKYKNLLVENLIQLRKEFDENCNQSEPEPPVKIIKSR